MKNIPEEKSINVPDWVFAPQVELDFIPYNLYRIKNLLTSIDEVKTLGIEVEIKTLFNILPDSFIPQVIPQYIKKETFTMTPSYYIIEEIKYPKKKRARLYFLYYLGKIVRFLLWLILKSKKKYFFLFLCISNKIRFIFWLLIYVHLTKKRPPQQQICFYFYENVKRPPDIDKKRL
jgi:hypothetical protein